MSQACKLLTYQQMLPQSNQGLTISGVNSEALPVWLTLSHARLTLGNIVRLIFQWDQPFTCIPVLQLHGPHRHIRKAL